MTTTNNSGSTPPVLRYNEQLYTYEILNDTILINENLSDPFTIILPTEKKVHKILEFQETLSSEDRERIYSLVKDYVFTHPNKDNRNKILNHIIRKELKIRIKGPYIAYLVEILQRSFDIAMGQDNEYSFIQNYPQIRSALQTQNSRLVINKEHTLSLIDALSSLLSPFHDEIAEANGVITSAYANGISILSNMHNFYCTYDCLIELPMIKIMSEYDGIPIPVYISTYKLKFNGKAAVSEIIEIQSVKQLLDNLKEYVTDNDFITAARYFRVIQEVLSPYIKGDAISFSIKIRKALESARVSAPDRVGIKINFSENAYQITYPKSETTYHHIESEVKMLLSEGQNDEAIQMLIDSLGDDNITARRKSDIYNMLVATYNKLELFDNAINANKQWISHCIAHSLSSNKRIARMYTLLAKQEASIIGYEEEALENLKKAMQYDPESEFYTNLYNTFLETFDTRKESSS